MPSMMCQIYIWWHIRLTPSYIPVVSACGKGLAWVASQVDHFYIFFCKRYFSANGTTSRCFTCQIYIWRNICVLHEYLSLLRIGTKYIFDNIFDTTCPSRKRGQSGWLDVLSHKTCQECENSFFILNCAMKHANQVGKSNRIC